MSEAFDSPPGGPLEPAGEDQAPLDQRGIFEGSSADAVETPATAASEGATAASEEATAASEEAAAAPEEAAAAPEQSATLGTPADSRTREERLREAGQLLILRLLAMVRVGKAYRVGNQAFRAQLDLFLGAVLPVAQEFEEMVLVALDTDFYLNGVRVPITRNSLRHHQAALKELQQRKIAGVRAEPELARDELETFFNLFLQPDLYSSTGLLEAVVAAGCVHFQPVIYASTDTEQADAMRIPGYGSESVDLFSQAGKMSGESFSGGASAVAEAALHDTPGSSPRGTAPKNYNIALAGARSLLTTTVLQEGMEMRHVKRVVQPLVDGAFANEPIVLGLSTLGHHDEFTYMHAVNVCMISVTMGRMLELDRRTLADLGVAALLHDVGKNTVGDKIHHPIDEWTDEERLLAQTHPVEGAKLLARSTTLNETTLRCIRVALEHHAGEGGYPALSALKPSVISRIIQCADCYATLQTHRSGRGQNVTPYEALGMLLGPLAARFEPALLWALVRSVGFYPPGQMVQLDDGAIALVLSPNPADLARPNVRVIVDSLGNWPDPAERVEFCPLPQE
ncbi:MAG: HD-GYP domain-containing protein, partial [Candidatus Eiseniibacteriota bacterium]